MRVHRQGLVINTSRKFKLCYLNVLTINFVNNEQTLTKRLIITRVKYVSRYTHIHILRAGEVRRGRRGVKSSSDRSGQRSDVVDAVGQPGQNVQVFERKRRRRRRQAAAGTGFGSGHVAPVAAAGRFETRQRVRRGQCRRGGIHVGPDQ